MCVCVCVCFSSGGPASEGVDRIFKHLKFGPEEYRIGKLVKVALYFLKDLILFFLTKDKNIHQVSKDTFHN